MAGDGDGLHAVADLQFLEDVPEVPLHRVGRQGEPVGERLVGKTVGDETQNLAFTVRQILEQRRARILVGIVLIVLRQRRRELACFRQEFVEIGGNAVLLRQVGELRQGLTRLVQQTDGLRAFVENEADELVRRADLERLCLLYISPSPRVF